MWGQCGENNKQGDKTHNGGTFWCRVRTLHRRRLPSPALPCPSLLCPTSAISPLPCFDPCYLYPQPTTHVVSHSVCPVSTPGNFTFILPSLLLVPSLVTLPALPTSLLPIPLASLYLYSSSYPCPAFTPTSSKLPCWSCPHRACSTPALPSKPPSFLSAKNSALSRHPCHLFLHF